jgi:hypothetical protein
MKQRPGFALWVRSYWSQCREIMLRIITHRVITHNAMIVIRIRVFSRAVMSPNLLHTVALGRYSEALSNLHERLILPRTGFSFGGKTLQALTKRGLAVRSQFVRGFSRKRAWRDLLDDETF